MPEAAASSSRWLVSTEWLAANLDAPDLIVVDGSWHLPGANREGRTEYLAAHIPGAVFFDIDAIADTSSGLPHMLAKPHDFAAAVGALGIGDGMKIVVYDGAGLFSAPRVWWTFRVFGAKDVLILDGGFPKWQAEGRPVEEGNGRRQPMRFTPRVDATMIADIGEVAQRLKDGSAQVVDARPAPRFRGEAPEPRPGVRAGHMPGSRNLPFGEVVKDGRLAAPEAIDAALADAGVDPDEPVITSCGSGVSAAILWLALDSIGKPPRALYDGSWAEWGSSDQPIETGPAK
ncbi:3-mercaptopyruvate sulfurtransferase [Bosea sp. 117]|uniref:3-mercaptopyruvate sulfurtransferase n=1 Tax=Bosea sp. 117 TaxID=1125973 RepID=UPI0004941BC5|nr:3-mercaptopyruvate sulfurtransferase [Bosea sp. 117]